MLKRDMEYDLLNTTASSAGGATAGRASNGAKGFVTTNFYSFSNSMASTNLITEDIFSDTHVLAWAQGGKPSTIITTMAQKRLISTFNGNNKITVTDDSDSKKVINSVDVYEDDAGTVTIKASRFLASDSTDYDWLFFISPDMWDILFLKSIKTEKLARLGPSTTVMIDTEYTLRCKSEKANAAIKYLYNA